MNKKILYVLIALLVISVGFNIKLYSGLEKDLPKQEASEGLRGVYGIDKNINEKTIDNYLGRSDAVYRDVRMLEDTATWENKGGERNLTGFVEGFEVIPYAYLTEFPQEYIDQKASENVSGLYQGKTLFHLDEEGNYIANYEESMEILEYIFPKDKNIFIMCGAGGYANFTKKMLVSLGWDESKIYNVGGYWNYEGNRAISTINEHGSEVTYDFWKVNYHNIDFDNLTEVNQ
ncbi:MAG: hypothetical protein IJZ46_03160 [Bacilli bacterium]|nr:hypothetical protein [Bacilli bacterium]